ncbi:hypothetical protein M0R19_01370 [Candidatus Pacearchaeota archaeon]|nr:hypothetical protein [Candidatus Pacearchaeota archaeon]
MKALSGDFLNECKKASSDKKGKINLKLFLPKSKRNALDEIKIKKRLKDHFAKHLKKKKKEIDGIKLSGFNWFIIGSIMIVISALFLNYQGPFWVNLIVTLAHPAGWFLCGKDLEKYLSLQKKRFQTFPFIKKC